MGRIANEYSYKHEQQEIAEGLGYNNPKEAMIDLYKRMSTSEIGKIFDVKAPAIRHRLKRLGVKMKGCGGANHPKVKVSQTGYFEIVSGKYQFVVMAKKYGISEPTIAKIFRGYIPNIINDYL